MLHLLHKVSSSKIYNSAVRGSINQYADVSCDVMACSKGSLTIRPFSSPQLKNILVNCSTFAFFFKLFIHEVKTTSKFWGYICLTNINSRVYYVYLGILLYQYIEISFLSYTVLFPPVIHNFLLKHDLLPQFTLIFLKEVVYHRGEQYRIRKIEISIYSYKEMP